MGTQTSYRVGDTPRDPLVIGVPSGWTGAAVYLDGEPLVTTIEGTTATAVFPADPFPHAGIYPVSVRVITEDAAQTLTAPAIVAEAADGWHTLASARAAWRNDLDDVQLFTLLQAARTAVESFAPEGAGPVPLRYRQAQIMQARNLVNASKTDPASGADGELFVIRPYPLDNFVKDLIRPRRGLPVVG